MTPRRFDRMQRSDPPAKRTALHRVGAVLVAGTATIAVLSCSPRAGLPSIPSEIFDTNTESVVLVGAGDIAICGFVNAERTARLLDGIEGLVFTAGDNAQVDATREEFRDCYAPTWGRHLARTFPSPGNHEYLQPGAAPYFEYFGARAGPPGLGYYTYRAGSWQIFSLNSNIPAWSGTTQYAWLQNELRRGNVRCRMAYWHFPVFSSGFDPNRPEMRDIWMLLQAHGTEIVISGHSHNYERFAPQDVNGNYNPRGVRQFVVGTGGAGLLPLTQRQANSEVFDSVSMGVLKLTLHPGSYEWQFIPIPQASFTDAGAGACI